MCAARCESRGIAASPLLRNAALSTHDKDAFQTLPKNALMRSAVRAYSRHGPGPPADHQAGSLSETPNRTPSLANSSRSMHQGHNRSSLSKLKPGSTTENRRVLG